MAKNDLNDKPKKLQIVREYVNDEGRALVEYENGMIRDGRTGHIVQPSPAASITSENARAFQRKRMELKRAMVREVASQHAAAGQYREKWGDMAYMAAITEKAMVKAVNPADPKQIDAARFLEKAGGDSEDQLKDDGPDGDSLARDIISDIAKIADAAILLHAQKKQDLE